ncbi:4-alpha-glucanotransferase [Microbacterium sp.]|uniref:4-alpha-glucanotransferase n=1 Tax=Microbacterium sp. TaxID=51671 RepID=UPI003A8BA61A
MSPTTASDALTALAEEYGIATRYWSFFGEDVTVPAATLIDVLRGFGVEATSDEAVADALAEVRDRPWQRLVPACTVVRPGGDLLLAVADGHDATVTVMLEDGTARSLTIPPQKPPSRVIDGAPRWRVRVPIPADMPLGWHAARVSELAHGGGAGRSVEGMLVVTPPRLPAPRVRGTDRGWGLMAQLYSVRSERSWGMGDFADLADLAAIAGNRGADFLLVNPVHAAEVTTPIEPSPYLPATRRFLAPLYVRPDDIKESLALPGADRKICVAARASASAWNENADRIDRDAVWTAKRGALERIFAVPRTPARQAEFDAFRAREGEALELFALWCALEEHYDGVPADERPEEVWDPESELVAHLRTRLDGRVLFHTWLQWIAEQQVAAAQSAARAAGMGIGIMHDLAVGVHPQGSDAWSLRDLYATGMTVGAPPDMYSALGQDWNQPPWRPDALAEAGYAPLRDMIRGLLRHAGALRIDHIIGLFRLWWVPNGLGPAAGTYVRYDHEAMIGVLALEAYRAGAVVIGEDLGTVEPWVREYLADRGILGTSVLWFERDGDRPLPPERYREQLLATVNTHDLPPTAGYLNDEHVALRARLGLLTEPVEAALAAAEAERSGMLTALRERGLLGPSSSEREVIEALHLFVAASPAQLVGVALVDAVGDRRVQNQPGTSTEYPNWQVPLTDGDGRVVRVDELVAHERFLSLTGAVQRALG